VPQIAVKFTRSVSTVSANFREYSRKTAKQFEKLKRPQIIYWSHFRDDTQNFANLGKSRLFTFESSAFDRTQPETRCKAHLSFTLFSPDGFNYGLVPCPSKKNPRLKRENLPDYDDFCAG
jgi:hypothetical protein